MPSAIVVRKAVASEVQTLAEIGYAAWEHDLLPLMTETPGLRQTERRRLAHAVQEALDNTIVADLDGYPAGWCSRSRRSNYIPYLLVAPDSQNRGIGSLLLRRTESMFELEGQDRVTLETLADNVRAVRFYERQGYSILAMKGDGRVGRDPFVSVRLEKRLQPFRGRVTDIE